jgi:hypothetical protein
LDRGQKIWHVSSNERRSLSVLATSCTCRDVRMVKHCSFSLFSHHSRASGGANIYQYKLVRKFNLCSWFPGFGQRSRACAYRGFPSTYGGRPGRKPEIGLMTSRIRTCCVTGFDQVSRERALLESVGSVVWVSTIKIPEFRNWIVGSCRCQFFTMDPSRVA